MPSFSKNLEKFLIFFFTGVSIVLVIMGISRIKKTMPLARGTVSPINPTIGDTAGAIIINGSSYQTPWGNAAASITVRGGKIIAVEMPSVPNSPPSIYAKPYLVDQALKAGSANIQGVSGATFTSMAFKSSLENALAKVSSQGQVIAPNVPIGTQNAKPSVPRRYRDDD